MDLFCRKTDVQDSELIENVDSEVIRFRLKQFLSRNHELTRGCLQAVNKILYKIPIRYNAEGVLSL